VCADHEGGTLLQRARDLRVVHLMKVNEIGFTGKSGLAESHINRSVVVKELGALMHGDTVCELVLLGPRDEHVNLKTIRRERCRTGFDVRPHASVTSPPRCHK
jgi:ATP phosphoribosyltransferase